MRCHEHVPNQKSFGLKFWTSEEILLEPLRRREKTLEHLLSARQALCIARIKFA